MPKITEGDNKHEIRQLESKISKLESNIRFLLLKTKELEKKLKNNDKNS